MTDKVTIEMSKEDQQRMIARARERQQAIPTKIVTSDINGRATSLRSRLTDYVTILKCGTPIEIEDAKRSFDRAVIEFRKAVMLNS